MAWRTLRKISHSLMAHAIVLKTYIHFALMYTEDHIFLLLSIKYLINEDGEPTTPFKLATGMKPSILYLHVLFFPCVVQKAIVLLGKKVLYTHHQSKKGFCGIFVGLHSIKKGILFIYHKNGR